MATGIAFGRARAEESRGKANNIIKELLRGFRQEFGSVNCYELVGIPYEEENWSEKWQAMNMQDECVHFVHFVVERWLELAGR